MLYTQFCDSSEHNHYNGIHIHMDEERWYWEFYNSGYGWGAGSADTALEAHAALQQCQLEFLGPGYPNEAFED